MDTNDRRRISQIRELSRQIFNLFTFSRELDSPTLPSALLLKKTRTALLLAEESTKELDALHQKIGESSSPSLARKCWNSLCSVGDVTADMVATHIRSWKYIIMLSVFFTAWIAYNSTGGQPVDPYPFYGLNLALTVMAALNSPLIMMSAIRQSVNDRENIVALDLELLTHLKQLKDYAAGQVSRLERGEPRQGGAINHELLYFIPIGDEGEH